MILKFKGKSKERPIFVVRDTEDTCRQAKEDDLAVHIVVEMLKNGFVGVMPPKPWACVLRTNILRMFLRDADYRPWTSQKAIGVPSIYWAICKADKKSKQK